MTSQEIRSRFLEFFQSKSHRIVPSAPMVIKDDPSLMFTNAGMNQFKEYFLGNTQPRDKRVADTQKCLRVSGKHNDLEEVGKDTYHHTMFEMLGNWSFGDYFKKEAVEWAWELLTEVYGIDKDKLYVTVFEGNQDEDLPMDNDALELWKKILPEEKIIFGNKKDNFWEMGDQGPCGPSSEIHVDLRSEEEKARVSGRDLVNQDHPLVVEIWNLVFIQFNRKADGSLEKLPAQHIDTGMGFERLCMVLQNVQSNYDTDVFSPLIRKICELTQMEYGKSEEADIAIRVVADHVRAVTFAIADGQLPSSTGAGYVIRRILRRAIRYGFTFLNQKEPFVFQLVDTLSTQMGEAFPELRKQRELCQKVIREEEQSFLRTLDQGLKLLDEIIATTSGNMVSGTRAFELYDTYGFPIDLTALILEEKGFGLEVSEFEEELKKQRTRSRNASKVTSEDWEIVRDEESQGFVGYDHLEAETRVLRYRKVSSKKEGDLYHLVLDKTPFYPEGGGQVGDTGFLQDPKGKKIAVDYTKREHNLIIHIVRELPQDLHAVLQAKVDTKKRSRTAANHSATHLLHQALRSVLGPHVEQKGSMVQSDYLRFDFSHYSKLEKEEVKAVEDFVNARIAENLPLIERRELSYKQAIEEGALALFGEKYGDKVRAIRFGDSMELCGGTHSGNTGEIWHFKIVSEGAVASGVRRIEAITGDAARKYLENQEETLSEIKMLLRNPKEPVKNLELVLQENTELKKQIEQLLREKARQLKSQLLKEIEDLGEVNFLSAQVDLDTAGIKDLCFQLGDEVPNLFLVLGSAQDEKATISCYISKSLSEKKELHAGKIVKELGRYIRGGGGGQAFFATAGGKHASGLPEALQKARDYVK